MLINQLLGRGVDAILRRFPLEPLSGSPLSQLEIALRNVVREACFFFVTHGPKPLHRRQFAIGVNLGDPADGAQNLLMVQFQAGSYVTELYRVPSAEPQERLVTVELHDGRFLFTMLWQNGLKRLRSLDDVARILMEAPPGWPSLIERQVFLDAEGDLSRIRDKVWDVLVGEYVRDYLWLAPRPDMFNPDLARFLFERIRIRMERGRVLHYRVTPLLGLRISGAVELSPQLRLRPVSALETDRWLNPSDHMNDMPVRGMDVFELRCAFECEESAEEAMSIPLFEDWGMKPPETAALAALNLLYPPRSATHIQPVFTEHRQEGWIHEYLHRSTLSKNLHASWGTGLTQINPDVERRLVGLFSRIYSLFDANGERSAANRSLVIALTRWLISYQRNSYKDWLIDCWVALEGLFTRRGEDQLTRKCAERISSELAELGAGTVERLYREIRDSYRWRSEIVHGERQLGPDCWHAAAITRNYLRMILLHRLLPGSEASRP
jgi:hypothetical protein